jgi:hypothetical protein
MRCRSECATAAATFLGMSQTLNPMLARLSFASFGVETPRLSVRAVKSEEVKQLATCLVVMRRSRIHISRRADERRARSVVYFFILSAPPSKVVTIACIYPSFVM